LAEPGRLAPFIRTFGMVKKELSSVLRQPRLIATLIVGPFLIVLLFGLGYRAQPAAYRTVVVLENEDAGLAADPQDLSDAFGDAIDLRGVVTDPEQARDQLRRQEIDLVIIAPSDPLQTLENNEQAKFVILHGEVDPVIRGNISLLARISVDQINRLVLEEVTAQVQEKSEEVEDPLGVLEASAASLSAALDSGDHAAADQARDELRAELTRLQSDTASLNGLYAGVAAALGAGNEQGFTRLDAILEEESGAGAATEAREIESALGDLRGHLDRAQALDPEVLVSPFGAEVEQIAATPPQPAIFYVPGTLILLIQHLGVTFAGLSLVRERQLGLTDLFRVSPLTVTEALTGKYLAFLMMAGGVAAILTGTMFLFGVPTPYSTLGYVLVLVFVILASLGLGFLISAISRTDSQAIQYSMTVLLVSIFFSGFILPLEQLIPPVRVLSYLIPGTYGVAALQDLLFRGVRVETWLAVGLVAYAALLAVASWWAVRRDVTGAA
jgi:ABC-2 type transport system permease protein